MLTAADQLEKVVNTLIESGGQAVGEPEITVVDEGEPEISGLLEIRLDYSGAPES